MGSAGHDYYSGSILIYLIRKTFMTYLEDFLGTQIAATGQPSSLSPMSALASIKTLTPSLCGSGHLLILPPITPLSQFSHFLLGQSALYIVDITPLTTSPRLTTAVVAL